MFNMNSWFFLIFFFKFWWLVPKLWLIKVWGYFQQKLIFLAGIANLTQIVFRSQHKHTSFLPKDWYIMERYHKKWRTSMCIRCFLTLATPYVGFLTLATSTWCHQQYLLEERWLGSCSLYDNEYPVLLLK